MKANSSETRSGPLAAAQLHELFAFIRKLFLLFTLDSPSGNSKVIIFDYLPNPLKNPEGLNTEQIYLIFFRVASSDLKHQNRRTFHREIS